MRCYICDAPIESPLWDERTKNWAPCFTCRTVISETISDDEPDSDFTYIESDLDDFEEELRW